MQTDIVFACFVEEGDIISHLEHGMLTVDSEPQDNGDMIRFPCRDEEGMPIGLSVPPFSHLTIVTSFEETFEWEDVDIDA